MYKLFLCLTFLHRKVMAYFAMLAVALCVTMLIIAISVMDGFLSEIESAAKGLFGDIVLDAPGQSGLAHYDAFIAEVTKLEEVEAATPFIVAYGVLALPGTDPPYTQMVQIAGIRLPERAAVTDFEKGLFIKSKAGPIKSKAGPTFDPPFDDVIDRLNKETQADEKIIVREAKRVRELELELRDESGRKRRVLVARIEAKEALLCQLWEATKRRRDALAVLGLARGRQKEMADHQREMTDLQKEIEAAYRKKHILTVEMEARKAQLDFLVWLGRFRVEGLSAATGLVTEFAQSFLGFRLVIELRTAWIEEAKAGLQEQMDATALKITAQSTLLTEHGDKIDALEMALQGLEAKARFFRPAHRVILGLGMPGLSRRTEGRETIRVVGPGERIVLSIFPMGKKLATGVIPNREAFTVINDAKSGVLMYDQRTVYVPFETLQRLGELNFNPNEPNKPPRCGQIHIKLGDGYSEGRALVLARDRVDKAWRDFGQTHPDAGWGVRVRTWRQQQAETIGPIQAQRTLVVIMFGVMSLVSVVLIFVIFYTIVVQHTRDIGVIKSLGGSGMGVAAIFLGYGSIIGAIGAVLGVVGGTYFVHYINEIHDWVARTFGLRIWSAEVFMFDQIPNTVETGTMIMIVVLAIGGGLVGAMLPAIRAARMQPVEALRYE